MTELIQPRCRIGKIVLKPKVRTLCQSAMYSKTTSKYKGVSRQGKREGLWRAQVLDGKHRRFLGVFRSEEAAARAYDRAALIISGGKAMTNVRLGLLPPEDA